MHERCIVYGIAFGVIVALTYGGVSWRRRVKPELAVVIEILIAAMGVGLAAKVAIMACELPSTDAYPLTVEDRLYFCFGALALAWVSIETMLRKFKM